jgi:hypothetical protein
MWCWRRQVAQPSRRTTVVPISDIKGCWVCSWGEEGWGDGGLLH